MKEPLGVCDYGNQPHPMRLYPDPDWCENWVSVDAKEGSTVHEVNCPCGFCKAGFTKA